MRASTILAVIFLCVLLAGVLLALPLSVKAKVGPLLVGIPGVILCLILIIKESLTQKQSTSAGQSSYGGVSIAIRLKEFWDSYSEIVLTVTGLLAAIYLTGLIPGICLTIVVYLKLTHHSWFMSVVQGIVAFALFYGVFYLVLGVTLYRGVLFG